MRTAPSPSLDASDCHKGKGTVWQRKHGRVRESMFDFIKGFLAKFAPNERHVLLGEVGKRSCHARNGFDELGC